MYTTPNLTLLPILTLLLLSCGGTDETHDDEDLAPVWVAGAEFGTGVALA